MSLSRLLNSARKRQTGRRCAPVFFSTTTTTAVVGPCRSCSARPTSVACGSKSKNAWTPTAHRRPYSTAKFPWEYELTEEEKVIKPGQSREETISALRRRAAELAKDGIRIDAEDIIQLEEEVQQETENLLIDQERVQVVIQYAKDHWRKYRNLPSGWSGEWENWEHLFTFFYPASQYFVVIPQIEFLINIRYAIRGEVRPIMFNNEKEAFMFEIVERGAGRETGDEKERQLYYLDWKEEELYRILNASTVRDVTRTILHNGGFSALQVELVESDEEGERVADRVLEEDMTVIPLLEEKYLGYTPPPSDQLSDQYLLESEHLLEDLGLGSLDEEYRNIDPELKKESDKAYQQLLNLIPAMSEGDEEMELSKEILDSMRTMTPEEMKPLVDLFNLLKTVDPSQIPVVADELRKHYVQLEREVQQDAQVLGAVLASLKQDRASDKGGDSSS